MNRRRTLMYSILVAGGAFAVGQVWPDLVGRAVYAVEAGQAAAARTNLQHLADMSNAFKEVTKAVKPSVVNIRSVRKLEMDTRTRRMPFPGQNPFFDGPLGDEFFQRFFLDPGQGRSRGQQRIQQGMGTGVIVDDQGYIITNNHVIHQADEITVTLSDDRNFQAEVVGTDEKTDIAVLKIDAPNLLAAQLGDSTEIAPGDWVLAMGNPFGLTQTVTAGIVSAIGRANVGIAEYEDFIQTDAAINPGNSGGPLVDLSGSVVGINTAIATRSGGYQGIGFAIPINMVKQIMDAIITDGKVVRGWLGVTIQDLTADLSRSFGFDDTDGVLIGDVVSDGPAEQGGLQPGDIIVAFDGQPVENMNQLRNRVAATKPESQVDIKLFRQGAYETVHVTIGELESQAFFAKGLNGPEDLGMEAQNITPDIAARLRLPEEEQGVVVTRVEPAGMADKAGLRTGDVVLAVGTVRVTSLAAFRKELAKHDLDEGVRLRLRTEGMQRFVFLRR